MSVPRRADATGRSSGRPAGSKKRGALGLPQGVGFSIPIPLELLRSPAYRARSWTAARVLDAIMTEHCEHGGYENGQLIVPYDTICRLGVVRRKVGPALSELEALGLIRVERGRRSFGAHLAPNIYRLTWLGTPDGTPATNEWRAIASADDAEARVARALSRRSNAPPKRRPGSSEASEGKPLARCASAR